MKAPVEDGHGRQRCKEEEMTNTGVNSENTDSTEGREGNTSVKESSSSMSPYATGGGVIRGRTLGER